MLISNRKVLESNFTRCLIELRNPMFLRGSWWTLGVILNRAWTFPNFQVLQLSKVLTEAIPLPPPNLPMGDFTKQGCLKTSNTFTWEVLIKYSSIIPCGDSHKEKVEAANKLLKDIYVGEIVDFAGNSNIKRHLNRIYIWMIMGYLLAWIICWITLTLFDCIVSLFCLLVLVLFPYIMPSRLFL